MALIACLECGRSVSTEAAACPGCGCPVKPVGRAACRECAADVPAGAASCPSCGCPTRSGSSGHGPVAPPPARPAYTGPQCNSCGLPASRACTRCGAMCCEDHITWWNASKYAGATCTACAGLSWLWAFLGLLFGGIVLLIFLSRVPGGPFKP